MSTKEEHVPPQYNSYIGNNYIIPHDYTILMLINIALTKFAYLVCGRSWEAGCIMIIYDIYMLYMNI